jgi:hypothetical protein
VSLQLPHELVIIFDPVTHATQYIEVKGDPTRERQNLSMVRGRRGKRDAHTPPRATAPALGRL